MGHRLIVRRLATRAPFDGAALVRFLARRAVPGVEVVADGEYRRVLDLAHGPATIALTPRRDHVVARIRADPSDRDEAARRARALLDLDADPAAIAAGLGADALLGPLVAARPGLRAAGAVDGAEIAIRAVLGQQVSLASASRLAAGLARPVPEPEGALTHRFVRPSELAAADPARLPMPRARARALVALAGALADGALVLEAGADPAAVRAGLLALPGVGPWTAAYVVMRALRDPDVLLASDLGVRHALAALGAPGEHGERWRPWRSYATHHLWASLERTVSPGARPGA